MELKPLLCLRLVPVLRNPQGCCQGHLNREEVTENTSQKHSRTCTKPKSQAGCCGPCNLYSHQNHKALTSWPSFTASPLPTPYSTASEAELNTSRPSHWPLMPIPRAHCWLCGQDSFKQSAPGICTESHTESHTEPYQWGARVSPCLPTLCFPVFTNTQVQCQLTEATRDDHWGQPIRPSLLLRKEVNDSCRPGA